MSAEARNARQRLCSRKVEPSHTLRRSTERIILLICVQSIVFFKRLHSKRGYDIGLCMLKRSTPAVAKLLGLQQANFQRYISEGRVTAPKIQKIGGLRVRLWTQRDIARAKKEIKNGRKSKR
jgi:predicted DNA-binding transcriptional regulator AlpA